VKRGKPNIAIKILSYLPQLIFLLPKATVKGAVIPPQIREPTYAGGKKQDLPAQAMIGICQPMKTSSALRVPIMPGN
jgi:hypothetical protein